MAVLPPQKRLCHPGALSSASLALTGGKRCAFQRAARVFANVIVHQTVPLPSLFCLAFPPPCMHVIHMHIWRVEEQAEKDGWRLVVYYRQEPIHNLWRRNPALRGKSCKSSHFKIPPALSSLLQITHGDIFRPTKSSE